MSLTVAYSEESIEEVDNYLNSKNSLVNTDGKFMHDTITDTVQYVLANMVG